MHTCDKKIDKIVEAIEELREAVGQLRWDNNPEGWDNDKWNVDLSFELPEESGEEPRYLIVKPENEKEFLTVLNTSHKKKSAYDELIALECGRDLLTGDMLQLLSHCEYIRWKRKYEEELKQMEAKENVSSKP